MIKLNQLYRARFRAALLAENESREHEPAREESDTAPTLARNILGQAHNFHIAGLRCGKPEPLENGRESLPAIPMIVCLAFASELYLKAFIYASDQHAHGHDLAQLFSRLSEHEKSKIRDRYTLEIEEESVDLETDLANLSKAFVDWRYIYEKSNELIAVCDLVALSRSLHFAICDLHSEWNIDPELKKIIEAPFPEEAMHILSLGGGEMIMVSDPKPQ